MTRHYCRSLVWTLSFAGLCCGASVLGAEPFKVGAATSNITPPLGQNIVGGFSPFPSTHVHDELPARCLVLDDEISTCEW